jgi:hypothetical protein
MTRRLRSTSVFAVIVLGSVITATAVAGARNVSAPPDRAPVPTSRSALVFHDSMRKLWEDHVTWTRNVIISFQVKEPDPGEVLPDLSAALERLLQNQVEIGDAIKPYYGDEAGDQLTALLREHILIAGEILQAAKSGDTVALADAQERWYDNAHDIAVFLNAANPDNWPLTEMDEMLRDHLDLTTDEVLARLNGQWTADVAAYDEIHTQALVMADMLSDGIIAQFPAKFRP